MTAARRAQIAHALAVARRLQADREAARERARLERNQLLVAIRATTRGER